MEDKVLLVHLFKSEEKIFPRGHLLRPPESPIPSQFLVRSQKKTSSAFHRDWYTYKNSRTFLTYMSRSFTICPFRIGTLLSVCQSLVAGIIDYAVPFYITV